MGFNGALSKNARLHSVSKSLKMSIQFVNTAIVRISNFLITLEMGFFNQRRLKQYNKLEKFRKIIVFFIRSGAATDVGVLVLS